MYSTVVCTLLAIHASTVFARPQEAASSSSTPIPIVSQTEVVGPDGTFNYSYESGNGIKVEQSGYIKKAPAEAARSGELQEADEDNDIQVVQGSYSYTAPDGQQISLRYVADENGFQPEGEHLPTTPAPFGGLPSGALGQLQNTPAEQDSSQSSQPQPVVQAAAENPEATNAESTPAAP